MDDVTIGRAFRAIRQHLGLRQVDVGAGAGLSQQLVSMLETGRLESLSLHAVRRLARTLGAEVVMTVRWRGAEIDRVRDEGHARVIALISAMLVAEGWITAPEVTYSVFGERGSIDLLAFHPATRTLLVVEVKTEIVSVEETLRRHDQKVRLAAGIARERFGWDTRNVTRLLAIRDTRTSRRRVERHLGVFERAYPMRGWAARSWLSAPAATPGLLMFLPDTGVIGGRAGASTRRRVRRPGGGLPRAR